jgi:hypothetical protein
MWLGQQLQWQWQPGWEPSEWKGAVGGWWQVQWLMITGTGGAKTHSQAAVVCSLGSLFRTGPLL